MMEMAMVEAVRAAQASQSVSYLNERLAVEKVADPEAVARFAEAMAPSGPDPVPFASQVAETWKAAHDNNQGILHRMKALSELDRVRGPSLAQLMELQYEVANLAFQQEVVTGVAKKASTAIETLVKNG